jgi:hypothetical protein
MKWVAVSMVPMRRFDNHAASRDPAKILIELLHFLLDPRCHSRRYVHVSEGRLHLDVLSF